MKVLLTGITGNLGHEVSLELKKRGLAIIPIVRPNHHAEFNNDDVLVNDLTSDEELRFNGRANCIVHCAGNVHFKESGDSNERMINKLIHLAKKLQIPIYLVSTAYIYRPPVLNQPLRNAYEIDKFRAEQALSSSGIPHGIFRPSVLVGNSKSGQIQNLSGYYSIVKAIYIASMISKSNGQKLRLPELSGKSNLIPVDQAAYYIGEEVQSKKLRTIYITNPDPPDASWILKETLNLLGITDSIEMLNISFNQYGNLNLTAEEQGLYKYMKHFYPYWSISYDFPPSVCPKNLINHDFLFKALSYMKAANFIK